MKALVYRRSVPRYLALRLLAGRFPSLCTGPLSPLALREVGEPELPAPDWVRVRTRLAGICGSDVALVRARGSLYLSPFLSFPFVPGHEIVGEVAPGGAVPEALSPGRRVVVEPVLSCDVRGVDEPCGRCRSGEYGNCEGVTEGRLAPGLQLGYCRDTGGGWSPSFVAHRRQLHAVPDAVGDEDAVLVEPFACALHAALRAGPLEGRTVLVLGGGTMGLLTVAALRALDSGCRVLVSARHPHQASLARELGADAVLPPGRALAVALARATGARLLRPEMGRAVALGGADVTFDCIGSPRTLDDALRLTRARGRVLVVGMPGVARGVDWTALWYKELTVTGAYTYGYEEHRGERLRTFTLALRLLESGRARLAPLLSARYPLEAWREALGRALRPGASGSVKTVFRFTPEGGPS